MEEYKKQFIDFMIDSHVLKFGDFTLKSGRKSPFFMNAGAYVTGSQLKKLGEFYAKAIHDSYGLDFDVLFGPAYKGIPLSVVTAIAISDLYGVDVKYCSNRKEAKDHGGDKGILLGSEIRDGDRVVIIEDVTTSGKSIEETFPIIQAQGNVEIKGLMVSLNRMERGKGTRSALSEISEKYGFPANAIVSMADVFRYLGEDQQAGRMTLTEEQKKAIRDYYAEYGAEEYQGLF
ncbi:MAG: orotate phosphoribosyltransferase [Bilifractor sp.]|jgi:orotate phosphoribosyltransferase